MVASPRGTSNKRHASLSGEFTEHPVHVGLLMRHLGAPGVTRLMGAVCVASVENGVIERCGGSTELEHGIYRGAVLVRQQEAGVRNHVERSLVGDEQGVMTGRAELVSELLGEGVQLGD